MRAYIKAKGAEISEENAEGGLHVDLAQIIEACDVCLKDDDKGSCWSTAYSKQKWQILSCMCSSVVEIGHRSEVMLLFLDAALDILLSLCPLADVESVMNSIVSLLLILETEKQEALIESLCEKLVKFREGERPSLRMQLWVSKSSTLSIWICSQQCTAALLILNFGLILKNNS